MLAHGLGAPLGAAVVSEPVPAVRSAGDQKFGPGGPF